MKEDLINICINWRREEIDSNEAMDKISSIIIPNSEPSNAYLRKLIALIYDLNEADLLIYNKSDKYIIPKTVYRKLLFDKYESKSMVASKAGVKSHVTISNSLRLHEELIESNMSYKKVFNSINTLLTEII